MPLVFSMVMILTVLWEGFETIILPRRVRRRFRLTRLYYRSTWLSWSAAVHGMVRKKRRRETLLSFFGPLSLIFLLGIWAAGLVLGFALFHYGLGSQLSSHSETSSFAIYFYFSGTTFFTLGLGDITPLSSSGRAITVLEAGIGFAFLAIVIGYLP